MRNAKKIAALLIALGMAAGLTGCGGDADAKNVAKKDEGPEPQAVEIATVAQATMTPSFGTTASLESERAATVVAEADGEVLAVLVEEGDHVKKGQVLARLEANRERLEYKRAASETSRLSHEAERASTLSARGLVSKQATEQSAFAHQSQKAMADMAALALSKTEIKAPYDGVVGRRHIKQGQWLAATQPAFDIADFSELKARIALPERTAVLLSQGQAVTLEADALPGTKFSGRIERIAPVVDRASGTVTATIAVDREPRLRPGLFVRVEVHQAALRDVVVLPKSALMHVDGAFRVFVVKGGKVEQRPVQVGLEAGDTVQAVAGVTPGEQVVTIGHDQLVNGDKVLVVDTGAAVEHSPAVADAKGG